MIEYEDMLGVASIKGNGGMGDTAVTLTPTQRSSRLGRQAKGRRRVEYMACLYARGINYTTPV